jgi:hypothetical protein
VKSFAEVCPYSVLLGDPYALCGQIANLLLELGALLFDARLIQLILELFLGVV